MTKKQGNKTDYLLEGNLKKYEDKIWKFFFRTERQCFNKPNYNFHHMIETDGISCSIIMIRNDLIGKRIPTNKIGNTEEYIDELKDYTNLTNKNIVAYDPGMGDIIFCVDNDNKDANEFRYTQDSRRKECKIKKYAKLILGFKKEKIEGKTIIEYETEISTFNKKTLDIKEFKKYIQKKCEINYKLFKFYENYIFRKLKLNGYINRKKNEQKMISNFAKIFGKPSDVVICAGDWEQKQHMKYKEPTKGRSIRKLFRQNGYKLYLVDEFRTSCKCSKCEGGKCEKFMVRENPKPYKNNNILVHGLTSCKSCFNVWNRDVNGATNIYKIAKNAIKKEERPKYLSRDKKEETDIKTTEVIIKVSKKKVSKKSVVLDDTTKS
jgi:transposase